MSSNIEHVAKKYGRDMHPSCAFKDLCWNCIQVQLNEDYHGENIICNEIPAMSVASEIRPCCIAIARSNLQLGCKYLEVIKIGNTRLALEFS